jgi:ABC-type nitrate/sulfonate/bicarbonate transport system permease component
MAGGDVLMTAVQEVAPPRPPVAAPPGFSHHLYTTVPRILAVVVFFGSWQLIVPHLSTALIPTPVEVFETMIDELQGDTAARATVYESFGITFARLGVGLLISMVLGTAIGVAMGISRKVDAALRDFVYGLLAMPYVIWALLAALWFGFTFKTPVVVVILASIAFVITNVAEGVRAVPKDLADMARAFGVSNVQVLRNIVVPSIMPFLFAAFRYAFSLGWKALAVAEVFGSSSGAGWVIRYWFDSRRMDGLFAYLGFFVIFAIVVDFVVFKLIANRVFRWRPKLTPTGKAAA